MWEAVGPWKKKKALRLPAQQGKRLNMPCQAGRAKKNSEAFRKKKKQ